MRTDIFVCLLLCSWYLPSNFPEMLSKWGQRKDHSMWSSVKPPMMFMGCFWAKKPDYHGRSREVKEAVCRILRFIFFIRRICFHSYFTPFLSSTLVFLEHSPPLTWSSPCISGHSFSLSLIWFSMLFFLIRVCLLPLLMTDGFPLFSLGSHAC